MNPIMVLADLLRRLPARTRAIIYGGFAVAWSLVLLCQHMNWTLDGFVEQANQVLDFLAPIVGVTAVANLAPSVDEGKVDLSAYEPPTEDQYPTDADA